MTDIPVVVSALVASKYAPSALVKRPETCIGIAANAEPTIHASATMTMPCAQLSVRRVSRCASASQRTLRLIPAPSPRAAAAFHSPSASAIGTGASMTTPRPPSTFPR